jgi:hypothetical protein
VIRARLPSDGGGERRRQRGHVDTGLLEQLVEAHAVNGVSWAAGLRGSDHHL